MAKDFKAHLPGDTYDILKTLSVESGLTMNAVIAMLIREAARNNGVKTGSFTGQNGVKVTPGQNGVKTGSFTGQNGVKTGSIWEGDITNQEEVSSPEPPKKRTRTKPTRDPETDTWVEKIVGECEGFVGKSEQARKLLRLIKPEDRLGFEAAAEAVRSRPQEWKFNKLHLLADSGNWRAQLVGRDPSRASPQRRDGTLTGDDIREMARIAREVDG